MSASNNVEQLSDLIKRQSSAFAELNVNMTFEQMAAVVARHMLPQSGRFLAIGGLLYEDETITGWQMLATANRERSFQWDQQGVLGWGTVATALRDSVMTGKPYVVASLKNAGADHDSPELNQLLEASRVEAYVNIPMMVEGKPIATLFIMSRQPTIFSADEINTFSNLGDQMATLIYARRMLDEARQAQQFALELVDTNRNIVQSETSEELAASVLEALPKTISGLTIALFSKPLLPGENPDRLETRFVASRAGVDSTVAAGFISGDESGLRDMLRQMRDNQFIAMSSSEPQAGILPANCTAALRQYGASVVTVIGLQTGKRLLGVMGLGSADNISRKENQTNSLRAIADQIAISLENRRLLEESRIGTAQLGEQVKRLKAVSEMTAGIIAARNEKDMLAASTEAIVRLLQVDHCGILLVDEADHDYGIVVSEFPRQGAEGLRLSLQNNVLWDEFVIRDTVSPMVVNRNDPRMKPDAHETMIALGTHSTAFIPIMMNNKIVGSLGLDIYDPQRSLTLEVLELAQIVSAQINVSLQNMRLLRSVEQGAEQLNEQLVTLRQLQQIGARISAATDEKALLDNGMQDLQALLKVDHCGVVLLNPDRKNGTVVSEFPDRGAVGIQFGITANPLYRFMNSNDHDPVVVNDVASDPLLDDTTRGFLQGIGTKALMILPLIVQSEVIGSIGVDIFSVSHTFSTRMIELAQTVSMQIALALQNLRLVQEAQRRAEQLQHITDFSQSAQTILDIDAILRYMMIESSRMLPQNQISISLYDSASTELRIVAQRIDGQTMYSLTGGETIPISGPIIQVWEEREAVYIPDLRAVAQTMDVGVTLRSWLLVPVLARGRVTGLVSVGSDQPHAYSESDVNLFSQMVTQFGIVLENTETYRLSQRVARNESLVNNISAQLQRQLDVESMLNITATELGKAIGARRARIRLGVQSGADGDERASDVE